MAIQDLAIIVEVGSCIIASLIAYEWIIHTEWSASGFSAKFVGPLVVNSNTACIDQSRVKRYGWNTANANLVGCKWAFVRIHCDVTDVALIEKVAAHTCE